MHGHGRHHGGHHHGHHHHHHHHHHRRPLGRFPHRPYYGGGCCGCLLPVMGAVAALVVMIFLMF